MEGGRGDGSGRELDLWNQFLEKELLGLQKNNRLRILDSERHSLIDFASNDYLSLNTSGRLRSILKDVLANYDGLIGSTGSRLICGHYDFFEKAEEDFARFTGHESALLFHSGYAANTGVLQALFSPGDTVFCDRLAHASLLDGIRLSGANRRYFLHNDLEDLEKRLAAHNTKKSKAAGRTRSWIVTESIFSMDGDTIKLGHYADIAEKYGALLLLDEAHAVGITGPGGAGLAAASGIQKRIAVTVYPMGKAPGLMGAFVCGSANLKQYLINRARSFIFSTAQPPFMGTLLSRIIALLPSQEMEDARNRIRQNSEYLRGLLQKSGLDTGASDSQIIPVILGSKERTMEIFNRCRDAGFDVGAIRPPSVPADSSRLRITIQSCRTEEETKRLADTLGG